MKPIFFSNIVNVSVSIQHHKSNYLVKLDLRVRSQDANKPFIYEIHKLGLPASRQEFEWKSNQNRNRKVTVENYYKEHYNLDLK
jgi:hypothetical protein